MNRRPLLRGPRLPFNPPGSKRFDPFPLVVAKNLTFSDRLQKASLNQKSPFSEILK
jgi:hypothetical protein